MDPTSDRIAAMSAELHQFAAAQSRRRREFHQQLSSSHYRTVRANLLLSTLTRARAGTLTPNWRDTLALRPAEHPAARMFHTGDQLAVREVAATPPAAWEPHSGAGWRTALETWYDAISDVYTSLDAIHRDVEQANQIRVAEQRAAVNRLRSRLGWPHPTTTAPPNIAARTTHSHRLHVDVWYRAGLAGGGAPIDWIDWLRSHNTTEARALLSRLDEDPAVRRQLEHLPRYWNPQT